MKHVIKGAVLFAALILQNTFASHIEILGAAPSFIIALAVLYALNSESAWESIIYSLICGALIDIFWGRVFGLYSILLMYAGVAVYYVGEYIYKLTAAKAALITFAVSVAVEGLFYAASFTLFGDTKFLYIFFRVIVPAGAYNAILQAIFYNLILKVLPSEKRSETA